MIFFPYLFILTLASITSFNKSIFISSFDVGPIRNKSSIVHSPRTRNADIRGVKRRIFGGYFVEDLKEYPFMTYLLRVTIEKNATHRVKTKESCGATLLSPTHALTAAHCLRKCYCGWLIDDINCTNCIFHGVDEFTLFFGSTVPINTIVNSKLKNYYIHPEHKYVDNTNQCLHRFDIAVLELATPLQLNDKISNIKLPEPVTLGWGHITINDITPPMQEHLKVATVSLIGLDICTNDIHLSKVEAENRSERNELCTDTDICSKGPNFTNGICQGDSGGPIICDGVQVGVTSWSIKGCVGPHVPNMYTRVDINVQWIRDIMSGTNITGRYMKIK